MLTRFLPTTLLLLLLTHALLGPAALAATPIFEQSRISADATGQALYGEGLGNTRFEARLIAVINFLIGFIGIIAFLLLIYAGYEWMMARGNEEKVEKAKRVVREVIIALLILVFARIFTEFVLTQIEKSLTG